MQSSSIDLASLREVQAQFEQAERAPRTRATYQDRWRLFAAWCTDAGVQALPAAPQTLSLYITWALTKRLNRLETVKLTMAAVLDKHRREGHESPVTAEVKAYLESCARQLKEEPRGKAPLTIEQLQQICALPCKTPAQKRDRAILLLGFASGWRGGELSGLDVRDVEFVPEGVALKLRHSKTDQRGKGREIGIHVGENPETCPVRALQAYVAVRGEEPGPLFLLTGYSRVLPCRMSRQAICRMVKRTLRRVGIDPRAYGSHSLRTGFVTKAAEMGNTEFQIMQFTGHRSVQTVLRYVRPTKAFRSNPMKGVL